MSKLLYAGIRRYVRSIVFWLSMGISVVFMCYIGATARTTYYLDAFYVLLELFILVILFSWQVGKEHEEGIFRNKLIAGHSRGNVYFAEIILGVGICTVILLVGVILFAVQNTYMFGVVPYSVLFRIGLDIYLVNIGVAIFCITVSCFAKRCVLAMIVNFLLVFCMAFVSENINQALNEDEYLEEYVINEEYDEQGNLISSEMVLVDGDEIKNPDYITNKVQRKLYEIIYAVMPYGHLEENFNVLKGNFGYASYLRLLEYGKEIEDEMNPTMFSMTAEEEEILQRYWMYSILFLIMVLFCGYYSFHRKDFL